MTAPKRLPVFEKFIQDVRAAWAEPLDAESRMKKNDSLRARARPKSRLKSAEQEHVPLG